MPVYVRVRQTYEDLKSNLVTGTRNEDDGTTGEDLRRHHEAERAVSRRFRETRGETRSGAGDDWRPVRADVIVRRLVWARTVWVSNSFL